MANSINKSIDELNLSKNFIKKELDRTKKVGSKIILIKNKPIKGTRFLTDISKNDFEYVIPATNQLFKRMVEEQYKSLKQGLENTRTFGYFMLDESATGELRRAAVNSTLTPDILETLNKKSKESVGLGFSLQKLPDNSRQKGSFSVKVGSKVYRIIMNKPPTKAGFGWVLNKDGVGIIIPNFDDYLTGLRDLFRDRITTKNKPIILKKIRAINKYLNQPNLESENIIPVTASDSVKELQFRLIERRKLYEFILKLDLPNINEDGIKLYTTELERVAASCVSNVLTNKIKYLSKIAEIKFILRVYPQVFELLINNKLLPTDIIK